MTMIPVNQMLWIYWIDYVVKEVLNMFGKIVEQMRNSKDLKISEFDKVVLTCHFKKKLEEVIQDRKNGNISSMDTFSDMHQLIELGRHDIISYILNRLMKQIYSATIITFKLMEHLSDDGYIFMRHHERDTGFEEFLYYVKDFETILDPIKTDDIVEAGGVYFLLSRFIERLGSSLSVDDSYIVCKLFKELLAGTDLANKIQLSRGC